MTDDLTPSEQRHFAMLDRSGAPFTQDTVGASIVKRYTSQEYADLQRVCALYLGACNFGNEDVERRRQLCKRVLDDGGRADT
jgi:hypothetical protein